MPAKGTTKVTERQKRILAAAKAGGVALKTAAAQAGVHPNTALKVLKDPGTREIFREIVAAHDAELNGLFGLIVKTFAEDMLSADTDVKRARLREEGFKIMTLARQLGNFGMTSSAGSYASGGAMTLGDILVRVSHSTVTTGHTASITASGGGTFHD